MAFESKVNTIDWNGLTLEVSELLVNGVPVDGSAVAAEDVTVEAGTDGLDAGSVQEALQALATRVAALEV